MGGELLVRALAERPPFVEQPERGVTYAEKIGPEDRLIDPARPAAELERLVRALHPHIGARLQLADGTLLGVHRAALLEPPPGGGQRDSGASPPSGAPASDHVLGGGLIAREGRLLLACADGLLELRGGSARGRSRRWTPPPTCAVTPRRGGHRRSRRPGRRCPRAAAGPARGASAVVASGITPAHAPSA